MEQPEALCALVKIGGDVDTERPGVFEAFTDFHTDCQPAPADGLARRIGEPSVADAICDRLVHHAHRLTLKGPTMRDPGARRAPKAKA